MEVLHIVADAARPLLKTLAPVLEQQALDRKLISGQQPGKQLERDSADAGVADEVADARGEVGNRPLHSDQQRRQLYVAVFRNLQLADAD